jgi:hypothetical protein
MSRRREPPEFDPIPGMTLREVIDELAREACMQERFLRRVLGVSPGGRLAGTRLLTALDAARRLLEGLAPDWGEHKQIMQRNRRRLNQRVRHHDF